jgi:hypothetical protein
MCALIGKLVDYGENVRPRQTDGHSSVSRLRSFAADAFGSISLKNSGTVLRFQGLS